MFEFSIPAPMPISVLLADDHALLRSGLKVLLRRQPDMAVVAEARNGKEAIALSRLHRPDVVVMDVQMPLMNGLDATREVRDLLPATKVLVLSSQVESPAVERAVAAGAAGFISKHTALGTLPRAIREVFSGRQFLGLSRAGGTG